MWSCSFRGCDLRGSNFEEATLVKIIFDDADVRGTHFGWNEGLSYEDIKDLKARGALFPADIKVA
jgi:uncharacterized protein YjbI with pentapeptide repeats